MMNCCSSRPAPLARAGHLFNSVHALAAEAYPEVPHGTGPPSPGNHQPRRVTTASSAKSRAVAAPTRINLHSETAMAPAALTTPDTDARVPLGFDLPLRQMRDT